MDFSGRAHYHRLKEKWTKRHIVLQQKLWEKHKDSLEWVSKNLVPTQLVVSSLSSLLFLTAPTFPSLPVPHLSLPAQENVISKHGFLVADLSHILPKEIRPLTAEEEVKISQVFLRYFNFKATAELEGKRLNRSYGLIGQEQHLARYPGDSIATHFDSEEDARKFGGHGMAPGLGAWGYFALLKDQMSEKDNLREKYYLAVQTFLVPDYVQRLVEYRDFFRFRKMLVVNPQNGQAVVAVIGDAGPAEWTGKHLGGSPEVMKHLERVDGSMRGPVLYFFIDDPNDTIPLGPVDLNR
ncbi:MAG: hypothetical protein HYV39_01865 [Candidatus Levybacteria bacterium]|nr:hypothetical protein [Candidatus Levybacteria bacterium]